LDVVRGQGRYGFVDLPFFPSSIFCAAWIFNQTNLIERGLFGRLARGRLRKVKPAECDCDNALAVFADNVGH